MAILHGFYCTKVDGDVTITENVQFFVYFSCGCAVLNLPIVEIRKPDSAVEIPLSFSSTHLKFGQKDLIIADIHRK